MDRPDGERISSGVRVVNERSGVFGSIMPYSFNSLKGFLVDEDVDESPITTTLLDKYRKQTISVVVVVVDDVAAPWVRFSKILIPQSSDRKTMSFA